MNIKVDGIHFRWNAYPALYRQAVYLSHSRLLVAVATHFTDPEMLEAFVSVPHVSSLRTQRTHHNLWIEELVESM